MVKDFFCCSHHRGSYWHFILYPTLFGLFRHAEESRCNCFMENTHLKILHAKSIMEKYGFKSAIFVSSPYHMRRIKMIATKAFEEDNHSLCFIPATFEKFNKKIWLLSKNDRQWILSEYAKIAWFLLYTRLPFLIVH